MFFKLVVSLALAGPAVAHLHASAEVGALPVFTIGAVLLVAGYHRNLLDIGGRIPWFRVVVPAGGPMYVRHSLWGVPLAPPRRVRVGPRAHRRASRSRVRAVAVELLPALLRWLVRKAGV